VTDFKLVISDGKSGKTVQREVKDSDGSYFLHKKIGDKVDGNSFGLSGYEFEVTGGSDYCGFPMRKGISGIKRKKILTLKSLGFKGGAKGRTKKKKKQKPKRKGLRRKKTVCGEVIHEKISQINLKVLKVGKEGLFEAKPAEGEAKAAESVKEEKKEAPKVEAKKEEKPVEKKEEKKQEKPKVEAKSAEKKEEKKAEVKKEVPKK
tara:strand:- start:82 stop:696 length:615 start_codon:yes stop_codon:yes gene_type:complete